MKVLESKGTCLDRTKPGWSAPTVSICSISQITANSGGSQTDGKVVNHNPSDLRLKRGIHKVGVTPDGLALYSFRYNWSEETFVGVMAQEVLEVKPEAVVTCEDGFYAVNYDALGLKMISLDKWRETKSVH